MTPSMERPVSRILMDQVKDTKEKRTRKRGVLTIVAHEAQAFWKCRYQFLIELAGELDGVECAVGEEHAVESAGAAFFEEGLAVSGGGADDFCEVAD